MMYTLIYICIYLFYSGKIENVIRSVNLPLTKGLNAINIQIAGDMLVDPRVLRMVMFGFRDYCVSILLLRSGKEL